MKAEITGFNDTLKPTIFFRIKAAWMCLFKKQFILAYPKKGHLFRSYNNIEIKWARTLTITAGQVMKHVGEETIEACEAAESMKEYLNNMN